MRLVDIPAHILFLAAEHRFLCIAIPIVLAVLAPRRKKVVVLAWPLAFLNVFFGPNLSAYVLYAVGAPGPAQVTGTFGTATVYNNHRVVGYNVQLKNEGGEVIETSFEDDDFNLYPSANVAVYPQPGERFNVRYLTTFPRDFVIVTNDDSPWARRLACAPLNQRLFEAERKYEFANRGPAYRNGYIAAIEAVIAGACYSDNEDILEAYRRDIDRVKADGR
jgi:hypothetical protein